jgi:cold shock CspA family protein
MGCRVAVEASHHQSVRATLYHVRVDVTVPGGEVVAGSEAMPHGSTDLATAVRDAFDAAGRRLQDHGKRRRGEVKLHEAPQPHGKVARFFPQQGYGFLTTEDGREVYFHEHAVLDGGFRRLSVGADVRFLEEEGQDGPQATTVVLVGH